MDSRALDHADKALSKAHRAFERLRTSTALDEAEDAWGDFLAAANIFYVKLKEGARGTPSWDWFRKKLDERRDDELLCYIHHARNAHQHRLESITKRKPQITSYFAADPRKPVILYDIRAGAGVTHIGGGANVSIRKSPGGLKLQDVIDKGVTYSVPTLHRGQPLPNDSPLTAAHLTLPYLGDMLSEAHSLRR